MKSKFWWGGMVPVGAIRVGSTAERLAKFYAMFGVTDREEQNGKWRVWTPIQVTTVIGTGKDPDHPTEREVQNMKRVRRRLTESGVLQKVAKMDRYDHVYRYSWRHTPPRLSKAALSMLNRHSGSVTWCNRDEVVTTQWAGHCEALPLIPNMTYLPDEPASWMRVLSDLLDFSDPEAWSFWTEKAPKAVNGKNHPLAKVPNRDLRLMVGLLCVEQGIQRNLDSNMGWAPRDHVAFTLHALAKQVVRESSWNIPERLHVVEERYDCLDHGWLRNLAAQALSQNNKGSV